MEKSFEKRKDKLLKWIKNPYNATFIALILFTIIIRIYYFVTVGNQPLWWDEAEYLNMARRWAFGMDYPFHAVRPVLFSLITAMFFKIVHAEFLPRLLILIFSIASVAGVYLLGKEFFNKKIGLLSSFFMSIFYLNLFFTYRLLVDLPSLVFFTFSAYFFLKYFKNNSKKDLYWAAIIIGIGTLIRLTTAILLFAVLIYLLITENFKIIKKKELWIAAVIYTGILLPYIIWGFFEFGGFVITKAGELNAATSFWPTGFNVLFNYLSSFPTYLSFPLLIAFITGLGFMLRIFLGFDFILKNNDKSLKKDFFLLLLFLVPLISISFLIGHNENRYILNAFPAVYILSSYAIFFIYNKIKHYKKQLAIILFIIFIGSVVFLQIGSANSLIKSKQTSYLQVAEAGKWLKINSEPIKIINKIIANCFL
jgi:4-amino-4-deoxy-L-arabinose transferase-like glycosyltransferase